MVLVEEAARAALDAAGVRPAEVGAIYTTPLSAIAEADPAGMLSDRLGARPGPRFVSSYSGAAPQKLLAAACRAVMSGRVDVAVVAGGIADASVRRARRAGLELPAPPTSVWSQGSDGPPIPVHRSWGDEYLPEVAAGAGLPSAYFALVQSVLDGDAGAGDRAQALGALLAPFTEVAARRPDLAWFPTARTAEEIAGVTAGNRMVAEPYTKLMCSFPTVDLAGALVVTATPGDGGIHPRVISAASEAGPPSTWAAMDRPAALAAAVAGAFGTAGLSASDIGAFDLYSCFPAAVLLAARELGVEPSDPRRLTTSGGLPYFGGPGASYSIHGLACLFEDMKRRRLPWGLVVGVGGMVTDFSVGIYSLGEVPFQHVEPGGLAGGPPAPVPLDPTPSGTAVVEAMTVLHDRDRGPVSAPIIGRTSSGARFGARLAADVDAAALSGRSLVGGDVTVTSESGRAVYRPVDA